jgi:ABC-type transport system involved in multi-copper enzyme maturation permease subunit
MLDALRAEAAKIGRHKATWGLVWIYPIVMIGTIGLIVVMTLATGGDVVDKPPTLAEWLGDAAAFWGLPGQTVARMLIAAYVAVVFAGEYGWNTWKLIVPHRTRGSLLAAKYALVLILFALAFTVASMLFTLGVWTDDVMSGDPTPAGITFAGLAGAHGAAALAAIAPVLVTIGYASLAAILTRSMVGALIVSIVMIAVESLVGSFAPMLAVYLPSAMWALAHALPGYHLSNLASWIANGEALSMPFPSGAVLALDWTTSLAVLAAWVAGLIGAAFALFQRQDIN